MGKSREGEVAGGFGKVSGCGGEQARKCWYGSGRDGLAGDGADVKVVG